MEKIFLQTFPMLLPSGEVIETSLKDLISKNKKTLLFFYPKNNTPGCTLENKDFTCLKGEFEKIGIDLIGVSKDSIESHKKFSLNHTLKNTLISDETLELHKYFGAYGEKNNYGKIVTGVIRSTFLLDSEGNILQSWKNIKATNHANRILKILSQSL